MSEPTSERELRRIEKERELGANGFGCTTPVALAEFEACVRWLQEHVESAKSSRGFSTYTLKHLVEDTEGYPAHISNGAMLAAAIYCAIPMKKRGWANDPNGYVQLRKELKKLPAARPGVQWESRIQAFLV